MSNKLFSITGPSCGGKTTLVRELLKTGLFCEVLSFTSRLPRKGELDGLDYNFVTVEKAKQLVEDDLVAEWTNFGGNYYGITKTEMEAKLSGQTSPIVIVEPHGLSQLLAKYECAPIYVDSTLPVLYERFLTRFAQSPSAIANVEYEARRLASIEKELTGWRYKFHHSTWFMYLMEFNAQNQEDVVASLVSYATSLKQQPK